jgi:cyclic pyranopterin phosphate synthase
MSAARKRPVRRAAGAGKTLTHLDARGRASMVDVGDKNPTSRRAVARGRVRLGSAFEAVRDATLAKGDVLAIARIAGIQGAKETSRLIPLCHPLSLSHVAIEFELHARSRSLIITCTARTEARTGVEMEALTGVACAALAVYDTCKSVTKALVIDEITLLEKDGGKSGSWRRK